MKKEKTVKALKKIIKLFILLAFTFNTVFFLKANCGYSERYDNLLNKTQSLDLKTQNIELHPSTIVLTLEHEKFPSLDGTWLLNKTTLKRKSDPVLKKRDAYGTPSCNSRLPFEKRDIINKEVVISSHKIDHFIVNAKYPTTPDIFYDPNLNKEIKYQNFGFKAAVDPVDFTYAYTLKLNDHFKNPALSRQLLLSGRLKYELISPVKIIAKGYEMESTPECDGYIVDEVEFSLVKVNEKQKAITFLWRP